MNDTKLLGTATEAARMLGVEIREAEGKVKNRSTAYYAVKQIPDHLKVRLGSSLRIHLPKLREWIDDGCPRAADQSEAA